MPIACMADILLRIDHQQLLSVGIIPNFAVALERGLAAVSICGLDRVRSRVVHQKTQTLVQSVVCDFGW